MGPTTPLPESVLTESATDVDAEEAGEIELEANLATIGAQRGGARALLSSVEVEWRALRNLGVRLEPSYERGRADAASRTRDEFGFAGAVAVGLFHDYARDAHLQLELLGRVPSESHGFAPDETVLPAAADLVSAVRRGRFTFRGTVGAEAFGAFAHAPMHVDFAVLTGIRRDARFGFVGLEARTDLARANPFVLAPEVVADASSLGIPLRLGVALPVNIGADATSQSYGLFARLILLTDREARAERE